MDIILIAACSTNGVIGSNGSIPWKSSEELKHFKATTEGHAVVMGRKTWESLPRKPLPNRTNFVLTNQYAFELDKKANVCHSVIEVISKAHALGYPKLFVIGGAEIYSAFADRATHIYLSIMKGSAEGNVKWPFFNENELTFVPPEFTNIGNQEFNDFDVWYYEYA